MANKFGIREVCDVNFYKYVNGAVNFSGTPTFSIDSAKTSTIESTTTTVYAQGGKGNARRMSWEGERTLTFTVEDALFSKESLAALIGEDFDTNGKISIKDTSTAGTYGIKATTLIRKDDGTDEVATITIYKAKLQSNLNLPFSPTGDPMAFTFTFDAFPNEAGTFMDLECLNHFGGTTPTSTTETKVAIIKSGVAYTAKVTGSTNLELSAASSTGAVTLGTTQVKNSNNTQLTISATEFIVYGGTIVGQGDSTKIKAGTDTTWYVI